MAKVTFLLAFSPVAFLSIQTVFGDESPNPNPNPNPNAFSGLSLDDLSAVAESIAKSTEDALEGAFGSSSSWTDWAKGKFDGLGFNDWLSSVSSPAPVMAPSAAPVSAPGSSRKIAPHYAPRPSPASAPGFCTQFGTRIGSGVSRFYIRRCTSNSSIDNGKYIHQEDRNGKLALALLPCLPK